MFRIIIAEFKHETNTFSSQRTDFAAYRRSLYAIGDDLVSILRYRQLVCFRPQDCHLQIVREC